MAAIDELPARLLAAAYHEAGHAAVAIHVGWAVQKIEISPEALHGGALIKPSGRPSWRKGLLVAMAGTAAYRTFDPSGRFSVNEQGIPVGTLDGGEIDRILTDMGDAEDVSERRRLRWADLTERLVVRPAVWRAISAIAEALRDNGWWLHGEMAMKIGLAVRGSVPGCAEGS
jgi:hypothetical protein